MTISVLPISSEKMTDAMPCLMEHDRMKSMLSVELCVGTIARPARYMWSPSTSTHRTGTEETGRTATMRRSRGMVARHSLCRTALLGRTKTSSSVVKEISVPSSTGA